MNLKKRAAYAGMAAALALSLTMPTFAAVTKNDPPPYNYKNSAKGGDTIISVYETTVNTGNLSVEVPLYLTLAVVKEGGNAPELVTPGNYYIKNTSKDGTGNNAASYSIGVTGVHIDSLTAKTGDGWILMGYNSNEANTLGAGTGTTTSKQMTLNFSGYPWEKDGTSWKAATTASSFDFPAVGLGESYSIDTYAKANNLFSNGGGTDKTYLPIPPAHTLAIEIDGGVASQYTLQANGTAAVPQFRVTYTVSALDDNYKPIGAPYAGPNYGPFPNNGLLNNPEQSNFTDSNPNP